MEFEIVEDCVDLDFEQVIAIYLKVGWGKRQSNYSQTRLQKAFAQSSCVVAAFRAGRLVGWARALSDGVTNTWIMELVVDPDCQRKGVGKRLLDSITNRYAHTAIWAETYLPTKTFGEKCGLTSRESMVVISKGPSSAGDRTPD